MLYNMENFVQKFEKLISFAAEVYKIITNYNNNNKLLNNT